MKLVTSPIHPANRLLSSGAALLGDSVQLREVRERCNWASHHVMHGVPLQRL
jgi:hypothetical protein